MTLEQFKEEQKMTYEDLARFLGIGGLTPQSNAYRYCKAQRIPNVKMMLMIKEKTKGKVMPNDIYEEKWKKI